MKKAIFLYCLLLFYILFFPGNLMAGKQSDPEISMTYYINKANSLIQSYDWKLAKIYLDSASVYEEKVDNPNMLGALFYNQGDYYSFKHDETEAHKNYYKAIEQYEKAGLQNLQIPIYHNLAFSYIQKNDTESLNRIIGKMLSLALGQEDKSSLINTYRVMSFYYECLYKKDEKQTIFLDSAIYYTNEIISIYENTKALNIRSEDIAYDYVTLASNLLLKKEYNPDIVTSYLKKSEELASPADTAMIINQYWVKGEMEYQKGNLKNAKQLFESQLALMNQWIDETNLSMYTDVYDRLSVISETLGNYKEALFYQQKKVVCLNQVHDHQKYEIIRELEVKYEISKKDQEIAHLNSINNFRKKINYLYVCICVVSIMAFVFVIRWLLSKKKAADIRLSLLQTEKNEALLRSELQEERLKVVELEKYEALLDNHFKKLQISEKNVELEELQKEQIQLNIQIENYSNKVHKYEERQLFKPVFETTDSYFTGILQDVYDMIQKRLNYPSKTEYLENLYKISDRFFQNIQKQCMEKLSALNLKYYTCFYLNMKAGEIANCFSSEVHTVYITRHRLKIKLNIDKEMDINTFLKQKISQNDD